MANLMMIKDDTKKVIKLLSWVLGIIIFLYLATVTLFSLAGHPQQKQIRQTEKLSLAKSPIRVVQKVYHLNREVNSYAVSGKNNNGVSYYFIYLPHSKKAFVYPANKGVSASSIRHHYQRNNPDKQIQKINLGWYHQKPVWEITACDKAGNYSYPLYNFKNGDKLKI